MQILSMQNDNICKFLKGMIDMEKFYGVYDCPDPTVLIEFDTEKDRQKWVDYERDIDKQLTLKPEPYSKRVITEDKEMISRFIDNPEAEYIQDELDESAHLYIIY